MKKKLHPDDILAVVIFAAMLSITFTNVIARYVFHAAFSFSEELVTQAAVLLSGLGASQAVRNESHYDIPLLEGIVPQKLSLIFKIISHMLTLAFCVFMTVMGLIMVSQQYSLGGLSAAMRIPEWVYGLAIPVGCGFMAYYAVFVFLKMFRKKGSDDSAKNEELGADER